MTVQEQVSGSRTLALADVWVLSVLVQDDDGGLPAVAPTCTVTLPAGTTVTPTMVDQGGGVWRALYPTTAAGRHVARIVSAGYGAADLTAYVTALVAAAGLPQLADVKAYLGVNSWTDPEILDALDAESAAQRRWCRVPADYPTDLAQALKRRCARNLALRKLPLAVLRGDGDGGDASILPGRDPEIRRLESNWRKVVLG